MTDDAKSGSDWLTTSDVATVLGVSQSTVRAYLARGQMPDPDQRIGHMPLWKPETISIWRAARRKPKSSK